MLTAPRFVGHAARSFRSPPAQKAFSPVPGQNFVPPMRSAVLFLKLASTGADLVFAAVFPSAWKLPDGLSQFVP
jgi:hypothetical protein